MLKVSRRGGFSDRNGIEPLNTEIQLNSLDERTRNVIINTIKSLYMYLYEGFYWDSLEKQKFNKYIIREVYCDIVELNGLYHEKDVFKIITETILKDKYYNSICKKDTIII